jgi:xanthine dehydrogenase accessory factor
MLSTRKSKRKGGYTVQEILLSELKKCIDEKQRAAIATIIRVEGSTYRREGVRCLITESGRILGIISGGCVEKDIFEHALHVMETGLAKSVDYDFRPADDLLWGLGVGCNGALTLWIEPFDPVRFPEKANSIYEDLENRVNCRELYVSITVIESNDPFKLPIGTRYVSDSAEDAFQNFSSLSSYVDEREIDGVMAKVLIEKVKPRNRLVVFGAGFDAVPLVKYAKLMHWYVTVVDHRIDFANKLHFPDADEFKHPAKNRYDEIHLDETSYCVVMTHNFLTDEQIARFLLPSPIPYLGMLGPRNRIRRILDRLAESCLTYNSAQLDKLHSPVGLDIGAESPEEIALSILAEITARRNQRNGHFLREGEGNLHERIADAMPHGQIGRLS